MDMDPHLCDVHQGVPIQVQIQMCSDRFSNRLSPLQRVVIGTLNQARP